MKFVYMSVELNQNYSPRELSSKKGVCCQHSSSLSIAMVFNVLCSIAPQPLMILVLSKILFYFYNN